MKRFTPAILIAIQCIGGQFAHAQPASESPPQVVVSFADLDLTRIQGVAALYTRINAAAHQVCASLDERSLERAQLFASCVAGALSAAVAEVDQPLLTSYYVAKLDRWRAKYAEIAKR